ncbi:MAG: PKD domain-containing protein, partial [Bacteroidales bacterium]|nr:PKD domain-containing protein [Bacteroidales bacterium]
GSELYPFYHSSGRLYFSSDNHNSSGGLDIFFTTEVGGKWIKPIRLADPFNSGSDDFGFIADDLLENGFFTSNRRRNDDIYRFFTLFPIITGCDTQQENSYCYQFYELGSVNLDTLPFIFEWDLGDGNRIRGDTVVYCFESAGMYMVKLNVIDPLTGGIQYNQASYLVEAKEIEQVYITSVDTSYVNELVKFDGLKTNLPNFSVAEYFWNFNDGNKGTGAEITNVFVSPGIYNIQLLVKSAPDNQGNVQNACVSKNVVIIEKPSE